MNALIPRLITALLLAPLVVWGVLTLPLVGFALLAAIVVLLAAWEWARLAGYNTHLPRFGYTLLIALLLYLLYPALITPPALLLPLLMGVAIGWWLLALLAVVRYPAATAGWQRWPLARGIAGAVVLLTTWGSLLLLQQQPQGPHYLVLLLLLIWGADSGAYFAGHRWGRRKLAPRVSPGKTWEGVFGALLTSTLIALAALQLLKPAGSGLLFILLCIITVAASILGDLTESMFKRLTQIKDSGGLLPGHGGVLDRIDSLTAAAPIFLLGLTLLWGSP